MVLEFTQGHSQWIREYELDGLLAFRIRVIKQLDREYSP